MSKDGITVSIVVVTYNHEKFIASTLDSIVAQEVNFRYEIIVGDDCSTDKTPDILRQYKEKYGDLISLMLSDINEGPFKNGLNAYKQCKGKYAAWLDGDDYWDNSRKLQAQVDFLEAHEDYAGCFHDARIEQEADPVVKSVAQTAGDFKFYSQFNEYRTDFHPWHLLKRNIIPTASLLFRNHISLEQVSRKDDNDLSLNWALHLLIIKDSKFRYFNEVWSVYNNHSEGISKKRELNSFKLSNIAILKDLLKDGYYKDLKIDIYECMADEYKQILLNPETAKTSRGFFYKILAKHLYACLKTAGSLAAYQSKKKAEIPANN